MHSYINFITIRIFRIYFCSTTIFYGTPLMLWSITDLLHLSRNHDCTITTCNLLLIADDAHANLYSELFVCPMIPKLKCPIETFIFGNFSNIFLLWLYVRKFFTKTSTWYGFSRNPGFQFSCIQNSIIIKFRNCNWSFSWQTRQVPNGVSKILTFDNSHTDVVLFVI